MLELIGVLAIMCILAMALVPAVLRKMDDLERANEEKQLQALAGALRSSVLATRVIPSTNTIVANLATQLGWSADDVRTNGRGMLRYFIVDPATAIGTNRTLPYTQTNIPAAGLPTTQPTNRFLILSTLRSSQATVAADCAADAAHFQSAWESDEGIAPTSATTGWPTADWGDVLIQRVDLRTLFTQVILNSSPGTNGEFSLDNTNNHLTLPRVPFSAYLLQGTKLGLHTNGGALQIMQIVQGAGGVTNRAPFFPGPSFVFERGNWRGKLFLTTAGQQRNGLDLQGAYEIFTSGPTRVDTGGLKYGGVGPYTITGNFYNFMSNYVNWSVAGFTAGTKAAVTNSFNAIRSDLSYYCKP